MAKPKERMVRIRVSVDTHAQWERAAQESGLTLSAWMRLRCNSGAPVVALAPIVKRAA